MNIALVIAGGRGERMHQDIPKQFINVNDKPVIIYTLEVFQNHPDIDAIVVVCLDGWHEILRAYAKQFKITKLEDVVTGGDTGQESIFNGLQAIEKRFSLDDLVLVHDGIRPMVSEEIISDNISKCHLYGNAVTAIPCAEAMLVTDNKVSSRTSHDREQLMRTQTPQTFPLRTLLWAHEEAKRKNITNSVASCTLMIELGQTLYFSIGSEKNIKLTTTDDLEIFKALLLTENSNLTK